MKKKKTKKVERDETTPSARVRVDRVDWERVARELDEQGAALIPSLLRARESKALVTLYANESAFRSRVVMAQHGFGSGEYKYFAYPLLAGPFHVMDARPHDPHGNPKGMRAEGGP